MRPKSNPVSAPPPPTASTPVDVRIAVVGLVLALCWRMTMSEWAPEGVFAFYARLVGGDYVPAGTTVTHVLGFAALTFGLGLYLTLRGGLRWYGTVLLLAMGVLAVISTLHARAVFVAWVYSCDWLGSIMAGVGVATAVGRWPELRRWVVAGILGVGAVLALRGVMQYTFDIPDTIASYRENQSAILAARGWAPDSPEAKLFEGRLLAGELTGFFNMSNVYATALSAVILVTGMILWGQRRQLTKAGARRSSLPLAVMLTASVLLASVWAIYYTGSRGGILVTLLAVVAVVGGWYWREVITRHWRRVFWAGVGLTVMGAIALVGHGWYHDSLPSKTMTFRWYYWTGAADVINTHPLTGVGLGNFGSHYLQVKRPQAPEEVKDPHSQFVRVAAELGLPVMALYGVLLLWLLYRNARPTTSLPAEPTPDQAGVYTGIVVAGVWWVGYGVLRLDATVWQSWTGAGPMLDNLSQQAGVWWWSDLITAGGYALALGVCWWAVMRWCTATAGLVRLGLLMAALALLLHDQINIAAVTGPVALLLWLLLGAGVAQDEAKRAPVDRIMVGLAIVLWVVLVLLAGRNVGTDTQQLRGQIAESMRAADHTRTLQLMDTLLAQEPAALDVCDYRIGLKKLLGQSVGSDLEASLQLNPKDARIRWKYAYEMTDLPLARRRELLAEALTLDAALAPDEPKRLTPAQRERIGQFLRDTAP